MQRRPLPVSGVHAIVAVFARPAVPGATKTRLAATVGPEAAAQLAAAFFADIWATVATLDWATPVLSCPGEPVGLPAVDEVWQQGTGDLGERLVDVFARGLVRAPAVIALGADAPTVPASRLVDLRRALLDADAAFLPARDGGFVALGLRRCPPAAFRDVRWSTAHACHDLTRNLQAAGLRVVEVDPWFDVDDGADLDELSAVADLAVAAPRTAAVLRRLAD